MLIDQGGRYQSSRSAEDYLLLAQQDLESLSADEREVVHEILKDLASYGKSPALEIASQALYRTPPVDIDTWLDDPYFCGGMTRDLFPALREDLREIFSGRYSEALIGGGIGSGKSTIARLALLRMIYEASCLNDVHEAYGVAKGDKIAFPCISVTESQAHELVFEKVRNLIEESPYFRKEFRPLKITDEGGIVFPQGLWIPPGLSTERKSIGINAFGAVLEEANFFKQTRGQNPNRSHTPDLAEAIYRSIKRRMESRFLVKGKLPGILIMISSKTSINSFTERRIKEAASNSNIFVREHAVYEIAPERYSGETFRVALGNESKHSRILTEDEPCPEQMKDIRVPVEFREAFESDLETAIREIAGYSTVAITPFISRRDKIYECVDPRRQHPFSEYIWSHDVPGKFIWERLAKRLPDGGWQPLYHPKAPRFCAVDFSKSGDATGFAVGCLGPYVPVQRVGEQQDTVPSFHIDFMLRIEAATKGEVIQSEIRNLIYELSAHGFFIKKVSADQFQSLATLQTLRQKGYQTREISVDRTSGPYDLVKLALYENRLSYYEYKPFQKELRELQKDWKTGKIDHPDPSESPTASKDVSDAVAQVCVQIMDHASKGFQDTPITQNPVIQVEEESLEWILENAIPVQSTVTNPTQVESDDWRVNAEKRLADAQPNQYNYDWRKNFQSPFEMG